MAGSAIISLSLDEGRYTIIAHVRWYASDGKSSLVPSRLMCKKLKLVKTLGSKYDAAIGTISSISASASTNRPPVARDTVDIGMIVIFVVVGLLVSRERNLNSA